MDRRSFLRLGSAAGLGALAGCSALRSTSVTGSWPRPGYDAASSGYAPDVRGPQGTVDVAWRVDSTDASLERALEPWARPSDPVVARGRIYLALDIERGSDYHAAAVLALDATTGEVEWTRELVRSGRRTAGLTGNALTFADGLLYVGSSLGVDALAPDSGATEWRFEIPGNPLSGENSVRTPPAVSDETLYVGTANGTVYALDAVSGEERWSRSVGDAAPRLAVADGVVYTTARKTATMDTRTVALDVETGDRLWRVEGGDYLAVGTDVYTVDGTGDRLVARRRDEGSVRWERPLQPGSAYAAPAVTDDRVVVADMAAAVHSFDAETGERDWRTQTDGNGEHPEIDTSPVVAGKTVYVGNTAEMYYGLDLATGDVRWEFSDGDTNTTPRTPAVVDGRCIYVGYGSRTKVFVLDECDPKIGGYCVR